MQRAEDCAGYQGLTNMWEWVTAAEVGFLAARLRVALLYSVPAADDLMIWDVQKQKLATVSCCYQIINYRVQL